MNRGSADLSSGYHPLPRHLAKIEPTWLEYIFYCAGFIFVGGGFVLYTSGADVALARDTAAGSLTSQLILAQFYAVAALLLIVRPEGRKVLRSTWPVLLLPGLAVTSAIWSSDPALTLRRAVAFVGTILFGLSLGSAFGYRRTVWLILVSLGLVMALSIVLSFLDPAMAIHQRNDVIQAVHAGSWRGIFAHRNTLGVWSGASLVLLLAAGHWVFRAGWFLAILVTMSAICLFKSGSSAGIAVVVLSMSYFAVLYSTVKQPVKLRGLAVLFWVTLACLGFLTFEEFSRYGLWLLGRESNLSGRTELWTYIFDLVQTADKPLGLGYYVGTILLDQRLSAATHIRNVNAHNGFLEAYVYFGWMGVAICFGVVTWILHQTAKRLDHTSKVLGPIAFVPAIIIFLVVVHNLVESTIVSPNNLNNVLLSIAAAMAVRANRASQES